MRSTAKTTLRHSWFCLVHTNIVTNPFYYHITYMAVIFDIELTCTRIRIETNTRLRMTKIMYLLWNTTYNIILLKEYVIPTEKCIFDWDYLNQKIYGF